MNMVVVPPAGMYQVPLLLVVVALYVVPAGTWWYSTVVVLLPVPAGGTKLVHTLSRRFC